LQGSQWTSIAGLASGFGNAFANGGMQALLSGQRPNWGMVAAQSFGQSLGQSLADRSQAKPALASASPSNNPSALPVSQPSAESETRAIMENANGQTNGAGSLKVSIESTQQQIQALQQTAQTQTGAIDNDEVVVTAPHMTPMEEMLYDISNPQIMLDKNYHRPGAQWTRDFANSFVNTSKAQWNGISNATQNLYAKTNGVGNVMAPMYSPITGPGALVGNTIGLINVAIDPNSKISQQVENYWGSKLDSIKSLGGLLYDTAHGDPDAAGQVAFGATEAAVVGLATRGFGALGAAEDASLLISKGATPLTYDISKWGEYGLPSDGTFVRTLTPQQYRAWKAGEDFNFGGQSIGPYSPLDSNLKSLGYVDSGYSSGMGFIGSAEEVRHIDTIAGYREALKLDYNPEMVMEFQLKDPSLLQNVLQAPYAEFVRGGQTGAKFLEWNYPGIKFSDTVNTTVRQLK
jgi:hypothetical protein